LAAPLGSTERGGQLSQRRWLAKIRTLGRHPVYDLTIPVLSLPPQPGLGRNATKETAHREERDVTE
jgi:hypothetical protein